VLFRCERDSLIDSLGVTIRALGSRSNLGTVSGGLRIEIRGETAILTGTDGDLTIQSVVGVQGSGDGVAVVNGRLVLDIVRFFGEGVVTVEGGTEEVTLSAGRSRFKLRSFPPESQPLPVKASGEPATVPARLFGLALDQVVRAAATGEDRHFLSGVLMASSGEGLRLVATDSYRLAIRDLAGVRVSSEPDSMLVPAKALHELKRILGGATEGESVSIWPDSTTVSFEVGATTLITRLMSEQFADYKKLIPSSYPNQLVFPRTVMLEALRRVKLLAEGNIPVRMELKEEFITLNLSSPETGQVQEDVDAKYNGAEMTIAFNPSMLIDGIEAVPTEDVVLEAIDSSKPATIRPSDGVEFQYLLMPVRVS